MIKCVCVFLFSLLSLATAQESFFHLKKADGKWYLHDYEGKRFFMRGVNHYGDGVYMPWNLKEKYGDIKTWRQSMVKRFKEWGFNFLPPSIGPSVYMEKGKKMHSITRTPEWEPEEYAELNFPFTMFLEVGKQYMSGDSLPDVFSEEFEKEVDAKCKKVCETLKDNKYLIGYHFCHNPPWHPRVKSHDLWFASANKPGSAGRKEWVRLMRQIYGTVERWREVYGVPIKNWDEIMTVDKALKGYVSKAKMLKDQQAFMQRLCEKWYKTYHDAIRKYDKNHLILGDRNTLHLQPLAPYAIKIMEKYVDALAVNVMGHTHVIYRELEQVTRVWDGPIILADTGAGVYKPGEPCKSCYMCKDNKEYAKIYGGLLKIGLEHPQIIGVGWCGFYETPSPRGRSGIVDVSNDEPLKERVEELKKLNFEFLKLYQ